MKWQNKNMFFLCLITTLFVIACPIEPMWFGWILSGIGGYLTGLFLKELLIEKWKIKR